MGEPFLTVLNYSAGRQSAGLLWMVLRGDLPRPANFVVLNANPGMENGLSYKYIEMQFAECRKQSIPAMTVSGPNLYRDLTVPRGTRLDNPPYWTKSEDGRRGRLMQKCTKHYKIAPMDRAIRAMLEKRYGISRRSKRLPRQCVRKWIGFAYDEVMRITQPRQHYIEFQYPLIDMKMTKADVEDYFARNSLELPPRSVCNACFANGLETLKDMRDNRPEDWKQAVEVDRSVRDLRRIGVESEVFVSQTLIPLDVLSANDFAVPGSKDADKFSCDSGYCFT